MYFNKIKKKFCKINYYKINKKNYVLIKKNYVLYGIL